MRVEVFFGTPTLSPSDVQGRLVAVVDVLRASTTIAVALANGARAVIPLESSEEVVLRSKNFERSEVKLAGERRMLTIPGFDLGNSPLEFTREAVEGKTVLMTTTNGTGAFSALQGARDVVVGSYVNFSAVLAMLRAASRGGTEVVIVCSGRDRQFSLEDAACAGRFARGIAKRVQGVELNDAARACSMIDRRYGESLSRLFAASSHGRALAEAGFAEDLLVCAAADSSPVVPGVAARPLTRLGPDRER